MVMIYGLLGFIIWCLAELFMINKYLKPIQITLGAGFYTLKDLAEFRLSLTSKDKSDRGYSF